MFSVNRRKCFIVILLSIFCVLKVNQNAFGQIPNQVDLWISDVALDDSGQLVVTVKNIGQTFLPNFSNTYLSVIHNEVMLGEFYIGLLMEGDSTVINTGIRLNGPRNARLLIIVDSRDGIDELNEYRNSVSINLPLSERNGFDLSVDATVNGLGQLEFIVENHGNQASPANLNVKFTYQRDGERAKIVFKTLSMIPALTDPPSAPIVVSPGFVPVFSGSTVKVTMAPTGMQDIDSTNDKKTFVHKTMNDVNLTYDTFLSANQNIADAITWPPCNSDGSCPIGTPVSYNNWSQTMKDQLKDYLLLLEQDRELPIDGPPTIAPNSTHLIIEQDAKDIYIAHVAQSLWFELHGMEIHGDANWTMTNLNTFELSKLFINSSSMYIPVGEYPVGTSTYKVAVAVYSWNPQVVYQFMNHMSMIGSSQEDMTYNLMDWYRSYTRHGNINDLANGATVEQRFDWPLTTLPTDGIYYAYWGTDSLPGIRDHVSWSGCWSATANIVATCNRSRPSGD